MADVAAEIMERNQLTSDDVTWLVPHQANKRIIDATASRMGLDSDKVMINIEKYGNTTNGTIPLCLWEWESKLKKGDNVILAAFGGGTLRDLLLDVRPFFWVKYIELLWAVFVLCIVAMLFMRQRHFKFTEKAILWPDTLGLGLFTAAGVFASIMAGMPSLVAVFMGVITGVFGGVLRDIVCNEIPQAFKDHRPYAICAFFGGWAYIGLRELGNPAYVNLLGCVLVTVGLRAFAVWKDVRLPEWRS